MCSSEDACSAAQLFAPRRFLAPYRYPLAAAHPPVAGHSAWGAYRRLWALPPPCGSGGRIGLEWMRVRREPASASQPAQLALPASGPQLALAATVVPGGAGGHAGAGGAVVALSARWHHRASRAVGCLLALGRGAPVPALPGLFNPHSRLTLPGGAQRVPAPAAPQSRLVVYCKSAVPPHNRYYTCFERLSTKSSGTPMVGGREDPPTHPPPHPTRATLPTLRPRLQPPRSPPSCMFEPFAGLVRYTPARPTLAPLPPPRLATHACTRSRLPSPPFTKSRHSPCFSARTSALALQRASAVGCSFTVQYATCCRYRGDRESGGHSSAHACAAALRAAKLCTLVVAAIRIPPCSP